MKNHLIYVLCLLLIMFSYCECMAQGLLFYGNEKRIEERSSYSVFEKTGSPDFSKELRITFEYSVQNINSPGYILLLKDEKNGKTFNFSYMYYGDKGISYFLFSEDGHKQYNRIQFSEEELKLRRWIKVSLYVSAEKDLAEVSVGGKSFKEEGLGLKGMRFSPDIYFGMCDYILETASFFMRNLEISNETRTWEIPLDENDGEDVHNRQGDVTGHIKNPVWLINRSYYWKKEFTYSSILPTGVNFDNEKQRLYIYNRDSLVCFDMYSHVPTISRVAFPGKIFLGMSFWENRTGKRDFLYSYELTETKRVTRLDIDSMKWEKVYDEEKPTYECLHHHCGFYLPSRKLFVLFGGYGKRHYRNKFLAYHTDKAVWDTLEFKGDVIPPRFFAGVAVSDDYKYAYIYGGKGNEEGDQNIGLKYYYDLYRIDLETGIIKKMWEQTPPAVNRVVARNMVFSKDRTCLYFLGYSEYKPDTEVQLYRMRIEDGVCEELGSSMPLVSEEIATNVNLYFNEKKEEFYCVVQEFQKYGETAVTVYSLMAPPVAFVATKHYELLTASNRERLAYIVAGIMAVFILAVVLLRVWKTKEKKLERQYEEPAVNEEDAEEADMNEAIPVMFCSRNAVYLFGTFTVLDRDGKDIAYMFSPKLRAIFLYILLRSVSGEGILSNDMNEIFWPEKTGDKIKNLKGVTINHIRKILAELDGMELVYNKGYFQIRFGEGVYCDYVNFMNLVQVSARPKAEHVPVNVFLGICVRGKFLNTINHELFDFFKQNVDEAITDIVPPLMKMAFRAANFNMAIRLYNILGYADPLNEEGMFCVVCAYRKTGKHEEAIKCYNSFAGLYKKTMNESYKTKYESITIS